MRGIGCTCSLSSMSLVSANKLEKPTIALRGVRINRFCRVVIVYRTICDRVLIGCRHGGIIRTCRLCSIEE
ncbi:MAG: hypothetical protein SO191_03365 [Butyricimonas virosa]|uniref:hypothetical protein n=1 Tax=Butyricimonas virosa TaxID=544645 RepID=UPI002431060D|nr:hypothetical protein [Butyricimonas virosa]MBR5463600.1 hypothetical protein [Butyricimonas sp.]MCI7389682.1 hypothetical protein [Butyricimonas virosa]MDY4903903.1 hypothetical protein [Butyricimonas virosa]MDY5011875.1 hypothetical protein [Butyricimonas virosa]